MDNRASWESEVSERALHVLEVTHGAVWGGGERNVASLLEGFQDSSVRLSLAVFSEGRLSREARQLGIPVHCFPKRYRGDPRPLVGLVKLIRSRQVDIVHTHMTSGNFYGRIAARLARGCRLITTLHYIDREALPFLPPFLQRVFFDGDIWMAAMCDRIIAVSEDMRRQLIARGLDEEKLVAIPNGLDLELIEPDDETRVRDLRRDLELPSDSPIVGIVARLVPVKNHALFLSMARRVLDRGIRARFVIVGDGPLREQLQELAAELGLTNDVLFAGFRTDVMTLLRIFDVCVLTSNSECLPYGVLEPMAVGRPVVATAVGGVPELIDHGTDGWLCPPGDAEALADGVCTLLQDREAASRIGDSAARRVRDTLSLEQMIQRLEALFRETSDGGRAASGEGDLV